VRPTATPSPVGAALGLLLCHPYGVPFGVLIGTIAPTPQANNLQDLQDLASTQCEQENRTGHRPTPQANNLQDLQDFAEQENPTGHRPTPQAHNLQDLRDLASRRRAGEPNRPPPYAAGE
jgi:hypothetical protein